MKYCCFLLFLSTVLFLSCKSQNQKSEHPTQNRIEAAASEDSFNAIKDEEPEPPSRMMDLRPITRDRKQYNRSFIPPYRTSADGRIAVNLRPINNERVGFNLFRPESIKKSIRDLSRGAKMLAHADPAYKPGVYSFSTSKFHKDSGGFSLHTTICDADQSNPQTNSGLDRYKFTVVTEYRRTNSVRLWGTPVTVFVKNPKTSKAQIDRFVFGEPIAGPVLSIHKVLEPMFTKDGRLLVARAGNTSDFSEYGFEGKYNIFYMVADKNAKPCDVTAFKKPQPIANAPFDSNMIGRYGLATYPFKDGLGQTIPRNVDLRGTYPWIDRAGSNLFFHTDNSRLYFSRNGEMHSRYPVRCISNVDCEISPNNLKLIETGDQTRGLAMMGLWSHGKLVNLDSELNYSDYGLKSSPNAQRQLKLYRDKWIAVGAVRDVGDSLKALPATTLNTTFIDSIENLFNMHDHMIPGTPRDVVWTMSRGLVTDEIAFDDYMDPKHIIYSQMDAAWDQIGSQNLHNGFNLKQGKFDHNIGGTSTIKLANAASSPLFSLPAGGEVVGPGRIEPVALGGIRGKGFWLSGKTSIRYEISDDLVGRPYLVSLFIDLRPNSDDRRTILKLPGGSSLQIDLKKKKLYFSTDNKNLAEVALPNVTAVWRHLAYQYVAKTGELEVFVDGMSVHRAMLSGDLRDTLGLTSGKLEFGGQKKGIRGWVDDIKLTVGNYKNKAGYEMICNHARGTLVAHSLPSFSNISPNNGWVQVLKNKTATDHQKVECFTDYKSRHGISLRTLPTNVQSLRDNLLFDEGPVLAEKARPDSTSNFFCKSCHINSNTGTNEGVMRPPSLTLEALMLKKDTKAKFDERRQPMQGPASIYGFIPQAFIKARDGSNLPLVDSTSNKGRSLDAMHLR